MTTPTLRVANHIFTRHPDGVRVQWLGHGAAVTGDRHPRPLTADERRTLALALLGRARFN